MPVILTTPFRYNIPYAPEVLADSPKAYWRLEEAGMGTCADSSGNGNNGSYSSNTSLAFQQSSLIDEGFSVGFAQSRSDKIDIPQSPSGEWTPSQWTLEAWVHPTSLSITRSIFHTGQTIFGGSRGWSLRLSTDGSIKMSYWNGSMFTAQTTAAGEILVNNTYHIVLEWSQGGICRIYKNGLNLIDVTHGETAEGGTTYSATIGALHESGYTSWFEGRIDEVAFYTTLIGPTRISAHYVAGTS